MKKTLSLVLALVMAACLFAGCGQTAAPATEEKAAETNQEEFGTIPANISIGTNPSGQAAYTMGAGIADVINKANIGTTVTSEETNGYPVNVQLMENGEIEFGFVNNMMLRQAYLATDNYAQYEPGKILGVMTVATTEMHVLVPADSSIETIYDFAGKRVGVGQPGGISLEMTDMFLQAAGYKDGDFERLEINLANQCEYMQDGQLDVICWIGSAPLAAVTSLMTTKEMKFLEIDDECIEKLQVLCPEVLPANIAAGSYTGQTEEIKTFGVRNTIAVRADVSNEMVYQFTKLIMENLDTLTSVHAAFGNVTKDTVTLGLTANTPLHPGALRYYKEIGVEGLDLLGG